jgi:hypothetical protein
MRAREDVVFEAIRAERAAIADGSSSYLDTSFGRRSSGYHVV